MMTHKTFVKMKTTKFAYHTYHTARNRSNKGKFVVSRRFYPTYHKPTIT